MIKTIAEAYARTPWPYTVVVEPYYSLDYLPAMVFWTMCNCYEDGKTTPLPFDKARFTTEGHFPHLDVPYSGHEKLYGNYHRWKGNCCAHLHMCDHIQPFATLRVCTEALEQGLLMVLAFEQLGESNFPYLSKYAKDMDSSTKGSISEADAKATLTEIEWLYQQDVTTPFIIDSESQKVVYDFMAQAPEGGNPISGFIRGAHRDYIAGNLELEGFQIFTRANRNEEWEKAFQANRFEQRLLHPQKMRHGSFGDMLFINSDNGEQLVVKAEISRSTFPDNVSRFFHVEHRKTRDFSFVEVVRKACLVALENHRTVFYSATKDFLVQIQSTPSPDEEDYYADVSDDDKYGHIVF